MKKKTKNQRRTRKRGGSTETEEGYFCSHFIMIYVLKMMDPQGALQGALPFTPKNCNPKDVKWLPYYFPTEWFFVSDLEHAEAGAIVRSNFLGAPVYGHTVILKKKPILIKTAGGDYYYKLSTFVNERAGGSLCWFVKTIPPVYTSAPQEEEVTGTVVRPWSMLFQRCKMFIINPAEPKRRLVPGILRAMESLSQEYNSTNAVFSSVRKCYNMPPAKPLPLNTDEYAIYSDRVIVANFLC